MDERVRKRKSLWDVEDENQRVAWSGKEHYSTCDSARSHRCSSSKVDNSSMMPKDQKDQAGWPSREPLGENIVTRKGESIYKHGQDEQETRERGENKNCYKSMSPGFDGWGQRKCSNSPDDGLSRSRRYLEGGRNRSRDRGRSRSHSPSWSRGRERSGIRSRSRSRSQSRSRNRNRNSARSQTRSRSPLHERRRESHGWNDRSGSGISSQTCRDFAAGKCKRGNQCKFFHPDSMEGDGLENDLAERCRTRSVHGHALGHGEGPGRQPWDKVSDSNYGEDDSLRSKTRGTICCKDFMRGNCKWGASCRFSHHIRSGDNNGKGTRDASFDRDRDRDREHPRESRKPLCKYFQAGKCHRDNCWFSHDGATASSHESRPHDEGGIHSLADKNGWRNGPTWNQAELESKIANATGWSESFVENKNTTDAIPVERRDNRLAHESQTWGSPEWKEKASENNNNLSTHKWKEDNGGDMGAMKSMIIENSIERQEYPRISQGLESHTLNVISRSSHAPNLTQEASIQHLSEATMHAGVSVKSDILQHPMVVENNVVNPSSFDGLGELDKMNYVSPVLMPVQNLNQNGAGNLGLNHPLVSNDLRDNLFFPQPPNVWNFDLNGPGQVLSSSLNLQNQTQCHQKEAATTPELLEIRAPQSLCNDASNFQVAQILFSPAAATPVPKFVNEQAQAHSSTTLNPLISTGVVSSLETTMQIQPNPTVRSSDQSDPWGDCRGNGGVGDQTSGEFPYSFQQKNQIPFEQFSPMSGDNPEFGNVLPSVSSELQCNESPQSKQQETPAVSEVKDKNTNTALESEKGQQNMHKENGDGHGKVENGSGNKDDKDIRLFKNALIEFVKEILKPTWKEGQMSREVHKTIVKKVVDKVTSTTKGDHVPKTQDKIDQYLSHSKAKITKLVRAYVERHLKTDS